MHDTLQWHERPENERLHVTVHVDLFQGLHTYLCLDHYVNEYRYADAINPFSGGRPLFTKGDFTEAVQRHRFHPDLGAVMELFGYWEDFKNLDVICHPMPQDNCLRVVFI